MIDKSRPARGNKTANIGNGRSNNFRSIVVHDFGGIRRTRIKIRRLESGTVSTTSAVTVHVAAALEVDLIQLAFVGIIGHRRGNRSGRAFRHLRPQGGSEASQSVGSDSGLGVRIVRGRPDAHATAGGAGEAV